MDEMIDMVVDELAAIGLPAGIGSRLFEAG
jgi:hypothetical protein